MQSGALYRHEAFYRSNETGQPEAKYLVVLAILPSGDFVARLLTSRQHARPEKPVCFHGRPYASYYVGVLAHRCPGNPGSICAIWTTSTRLSFGGASTPGASRPSCISHGPCLPNYWLVPQAPRTQRSCRNARFAMRWRSCVSQGSRASVRSISRIFAMRAIERRLMESRFALSNR